MVVKIVKNEYLRSLSHKFKIDFVVLVGEARRNHRHLLQHWVHDDSKLAEDMMDAIERQAWIEVAFISVLIHNPYDTEEQDRAVEAARPAPDIGRD